jgi:hypothetical protein
MTKVIQDILTECARQNQLWGHDFDDQNTANDFVAFITHYVASGAYDGRKGVYSSAKFRENLVKAAGLCMAAIEAIDRNGDCAPRHYENLPRAGAKELTVDEVVEIANTEDPHADANINAIHDANAEAED